MDYTGCALTGTNFLENTIIYQLIFNFFYIVFVFCIEDKIRNHYSPFGWKDIGLARSFP